ncbi:MAG: hypothetical protein GXP18_00610 [Gammaproteobacteria bacterium]|nr:hypothetical protein [Gammaproteobacteria bacterium]
MPTRCLAIKVGWNKRSGSTKRERDLFKVCSVIDVDPDSPFAGDLLFLTSISGGTAALVPLYIGGLRNISY